MSDAYRNAEAERRTANGLLFGHVVEVDHDARRAVVEIEDGWRLRPLPWLERRAGRVRTSSPPTVGEQVLVLSPGGEPGVGVILPGAPSDAVAPETRADLELTETDDGFADVWDAEAQTRTLTVPEGGRLIVAVAGEVVADFSAEAVLLKVGASEVRVTSDAIVLDGDVDLGGEGGLGVARINDAISTSPPRIVAGSSRVRAK